MCKLWLETAIDGDCRIDNELRTVTVIIDICDDVGQCHLIQASSLSLHHQLSYWWQDSFTFTGNSETKTILFLLETVSISQPAAAGATIK